jgi:hypothetical protein
MRKTRKFPSIGRTLALALCAPYCASAALTVVCALESPVAYSGEPVTVHVWVTDESGSPVSPDPSIRWSADRGEIKGGARAVWTISGIQEQAIVGAVVHVDAGASGTQSCNVKIIVLPPRQGSVKETPMERSQRMAARLFLFPNKPEPREFGLRSYLLFATPPKNDTERERYVKAIEAYLRLLVPAEDLLAQNARVSEINCTMLPLKRKIELPPDLSNAASALAAAGTIEQNYDYARAGLLAGELGVDVSSGGPYLLSRGRRDGRAQLLIDMTGVSPAMMWDWMKWFCWLTAQERSWNEVAVSKLGLNLRNVIAVTGSVGEVVLTSMAQWMFVLKRQ